MPTKNDSGNRNQRAIPLVGSKRQSRYEQKLNRLKMELAMGFEQVSNGQHSAYPLDRLLKDIGLRR